MTREPIYRMERKNGNLYRVMYYFDSNTNSYKRSKFIKQVPKKQTKKKKELAKKAKKIKIKSVPKPKPTNSPVKKSPPQPPEPRQQSTTPRRYRSTAAENLVGSYSRLGRR